jgi:predicted secreted hydrolase
MILGKTLLITVSSKVKTSSWRCSATNRTYPVRWHVRLPDGTVLNIKPVTNAQEVESRASAGFNYYEGAIEVSGSAGGVGYMELTGYPPQRP